VRNLEDGYSEFFEFSSLDENDEGQSIFGMRFQSEDLWRMEDIVKRKVKEIVLSASEYDDNSNLILTKLP